MTKRRITMTIKTTDPTTTPDRSSSSLLDLSISHWWWWEVYWMISMKVVHCSARLEDLQRWNLWGDYRSKWRRNRWSSGSWCIHLLATHRLSRCSTNRIRSRAVRQRWSLWWVWWCESAPSNLIPIRYVIHRDTWHLTSPRQDYLRHLWWWVRR